MLTISTQLLKQGNQQIDIQVSITGPGGTPGIESVKVTAIDNSVLDKETPAGCPGDYLFSVKGIAFTALPIYIEATECQSGIDQGQAIHIKTSVGPLFGELIGIVDCKAPGQNLNNATCIKLQTSIQDLRNAILNQCATAAQIKSKRDTAAAVAAALFVAAGVAFAIAAATVWPFNAIAAAIGVLLLVVVIGLSLFALDLNSQLDEQNGEISQKRSELSKLVSRLNDVCCPEFITVMRDVPLCP